jgi:hypothetical protein
MVCKQEVEKGKKKKILPQKNGVHFFSAGMTGSTLNPVRVFHHGFTAPTHSACEA